MSHEQETKEELMMEILFVNRAESIHESMNTEMIRKVHFKAWVQDFG